MHIEVEAVNEIRERAAQVAAVFVVDGAILIQVGEFDIAGAGIQSLKGAGGDFFRGLKDAIHFIQEKRTNWVTRFGFGDGAIRQAKSPQNGFGIGHGKHFVAHQGKVARNAVTPIFETRPVV